MPTNFAHRITLVVGLTDNTGNKLDAGLVIREMIVPALDARGYSGFSVSEQQGYWQGQAERSLRIEVLTEEPEHMALGNARTLAHYLAARCRQDAVLWSVEPVEGGLVNAHAEEV